MPSAGGRQLAQGPQLEPQLPDERQIGDVDGEHLERPVVVLEAQLDGLVGPGRGVAGERRAQLARLGDLVGGEDRLGVAAGRGDLLAQGGLAGALVLDARVVAQDRDELGDPVAEARAQVLGGRVGVLDRVVQQSGRDDLVVEPAVLQQDRDLERMEDERGEVRLAPLAGVQRRGVLVRGAGQRQLGDEGWEAGGAQRR
jgi:hypothetical protein